MKFFLARLISQIFLLRYRFNPRIQIGRRVICNHKLKIKGSGQIIIHDNVNLWSHAEPTQLLTFSPEAIIEIGQNSRLNGCTLQARQRIQIGEDCLIGSALITDNDFHSSNPSDRFDTTKIPTKPVLIKDKAWIAGQSVILKGVHIGANSVVAIRAVVSKSVDSNVVVAGNPAQKVKELS